MEDAVCVDATEIRRDEGLSHSIGIPLVGPRGQKYSTDQAVQLVCGDCVQCGAPLFSDDTYPRKSGALTGVRRLVGPFQERVPWMARFYGFGSDGTIGIPFHCGRADSGRRRE